MRWSAVLMLVGLMLLMSAAVAAGSAAYTGVKPDEFMKRWLVLGPIPVSTDRSPDEDAQKKAFADDLLGHFRHSQLHEQTGFHGTRDRPGQNRRSHPILQK